MYGRFINYSFILLFLSIGCAGTGLGTHVPASMTATSAAAAAAAGSASIFVPKKGRSTSKRHRGFVSPSAQSISVIVNGTSEQNYDLSTSNPNCTEVTDGLDCLIPFSAPVGLDTITFQLFDKPAEYVDYGIGALIGENTSKYSIYDDTTSIDVDIHGIVSQVTIQLQYDYIGQTLTTETSPITTVGVTVNAYDPDGNLIDEGDYDSPITLSDRDASGITKLSQTTITAVASPSATLNYYGGFIKATGIDASTPTISATQAANGAISPAGLAFDSMGEIGKFSSIATRSNGKAIKAFSRTVESRKRDDTDGNITWDGNFLTDCSVQYDEDCNLVQLAEGETLTMPFSWTSAQNPSEFSTEISGGELTISYSPNPVGVGQSTCVTVYAPAMNGSFGDLFQINGNSPPNSNASSPLMDIGFGVSSPLNVPVSDYYTRYHDC